MTDTCCICLDNINETDIVQKFTCGHEIHHKCFQLVINNCTNL